MLKYTPSEKLPIKKHTLENGRVLDTFEYAEELAGHHPVYLETLDSVYSKDPLLARILLEKGVIKPEKIQRITNIPEVLYYLIETNQLERPSTFLFQHFPTNAKVIAELIEEKYMFFDQVRSRRADLFPEVWLELYRKGEFSREKLHQTIPPKCIKTVISEKLARIEDFPEMIDQDPALVKWQYLVDQGIHLSSTFNPLQSTKAILTLLEANMITSKDIPDSAFNSNMVRALYKLEKFPYSDLPISMKKSTSVAKFYVGEDPHNFSLLSEENKNRLDVQLSLVLNHPNCVSILFEEQGILERSFQKLVLEAHTHKNLEAEIQLLKTALHECHRLPISEEVFNVLVFNHAEEYKEAFRGELESYFSNIYEDYQKEKEIYLPHPRYPYDPNVIYELFSKKVETLDLYPKEAQLDIDFLMQHLKKHPKEVHFVLDQFDRDEDRFVFFLLQVPEIIPFIPDEMFTTHLSLLKREEMQPLLEDSGFFKKLCRNLPENFDFLIHLAREKTKFRSPLSTYALNYFDVGLPYEEENFEAFDHLAERGKEFLEGVNPIFVFASAREIEQLIRLYYPAYQKVVQRSNRPESLFDFLKTLGLHTKNIQLMYQNKELSTRTIESLSRFLSLSLGQTEKDSPIFHYFQEKKKEETHFFNILSKTLVYGKKEVIEELLHNEHLTDSILQKRTLDHHQKNSLLGLLARNYQAEVSIFTVLDIIERMRTDRCSLSQVLQDLNIEPRTWRNLYENLNITNPELHDYIALQLKSNQKTGYQKLIGLGYVILRAGYRTRAEFELEFPDCNLTEIAYALRKMAVGRRLEELDRKWTAIDTIVEGQASTSPSKNPAKGTALQNTKPQKTKVKKPAKV